MSTVMQPRGPLPARVYWVRRLLALGALVVLVAVVWWLVPNGGTSGPAAARPADGTRHHPAASASGGTHGAQTRAVTHPPSGSGSAATGPSGAGRSGPGPHAAGSGSSSAPRKHSSGPPAHGGGGTGTSSPPSSTLQPTGPCDATKLAVQVRLPAQAVEGSGARIGLVLSTGDGTACTLGITPSHLDVAVTRNGNTVWESTNCPDELPARNVVVGPTPALVYAFEWDGHVDSMGCRTGPKIAGPGIYEVDAAFIGGEPDKGYLPIVPESAGGTAR